MAIRKTDQSYLVKSDGNIETYTARDPVSILIDNPGYKFVKWNSAPNGSGLTTLTANEVINTISPVSTTAYTTYFKDDTTLYAQWEKEEKKLSIDVYTWENQDETTENVYSTTLIDCNNISTETTQQHNEINVSYAELTATLKITAPGIIVVAPLAGEYLSSGGGHTINKYADFNANNATKTLTIDLTKLTLLRIAKLPVEKSIYYSNKTHGKIERYFDNGTIFGGVKYAIHWYDDNKYDVQLTNRTEVIFGSSPTPYSFNESDSGFVNIAHMGAVVSHKMHMSCLLENEDETTTTLLSAQYSRLARSKKDDEDNYGTIMFNSINNTYKYTTANGKAYVVSSFWAKDGTTTEAGYPTGIIEIDLRDKQLSDVYSIGYAVRDDSSSCAGIKLKCKYKLTAYFE